MQIMSVKKNHIARSNEGTGVFLFFFFFRNFGRDISCDINLSLTDVLCRNIYIVRMLRMKYNYLLSFDICLIFYIENGISKIAGNSRYINFYLIRRGRNKRAGGKNRGTFVVRTRMEMEIRISIRKLFCTFYVSSRKNL